MYGITNASKGIQDAATRQDVADAIATAQTYTDTHKGYSVITATGTSVTTSWNTEVRIGVSAATTITLPATPAVSDNQTHELRVIVKFASGITPSLTFTANSGQVLKWPDDQPTWSTMAGKLFEISFSPIYTEGTTTYVVGYAKEISLA